MIKPIEAALEKITNRFLLATVVSRRWESIVLGRPPVVETTPNEPRIDIVLREILEERIVVDHETLQINVIGQPEAEDSEETLFSEAFNPTSASVQEIVGTPNEDAKT
ncbi:MAG: DNA-directed RNA polymerase subunit omega [Acidobacteriota bacterium]|nr:DNA-directed RNA polymerase subunit omega [Acidobacteriota bacterium]